MRLGSGSCLASALALAAFLAVPATLHAADLSGSSVKDGYAPASAMPSIAQPCYMRGDIGYGWQRSPTADYAGNGGGARTSLDHTSMDGGEVIEIGAGCGSGSRGLRGDITIGFRPGREMKGNAQIASLTPNEQPMMARIDTYTAMVNGYYDFGSYRGLVPYVGAGLGLAFNDMEYVRLGQAGSIDPQSGATKVSYAWSLMAGVAYQLTSRAILDVGYRYIDTGWAQSGEVQSVAGSPRLYA
ncbi:MAG: outer membrane protein, partial [Hyphomicrobiaceae bacterium]